MSLKHTLSRTGAALRSLLNPGAVSPADIGLGAEFQKTLRDAGASKTDTAKIAGELKSDPLAAVRSLIDLGRATARPAEAAQGSVYLESKIASLTEAKAALASERDALKAEVSKGAEEIARLKAEHRTAARQAADIMAGFGVPPVEELKPSTGPTLAKSVRDIFAEQVARAGSR